MNHKLFQRHYGHVYVTELAFLGVVKPLGVNWINILVVMLCYIRFSYSVQHTGKNHKLGGNLVVYPLNYALHLHLLHAWEEHDE